MTAGTGALKGLRILVVDDNQDALETLVTLLELNGAQARSCRTARQARELLAGFRADLVISDLGMPGEDGFDLIMSIRRLSADEGGETPAIAFSGSADPGARARALQCGFQEFVPKLQIFRLMSAVAALTAHGRS